MGQTTTTVLYIHPVSGRDSQSGTAEAPFKTLTRALQQAQSGTLIYLATGTYSQDTGEQFPLKIASGITVAGEHAQAVISGGGAFASSEFGQQTVTLVLQDRAQLRGLTVTNPQTQGTGVWIDQGSPILVRNRLYRCQRDGVLVLGNALPVILENEFLENGASGLFMVRQAKGEVRQNTFRQTGYGIAISDQAAPLLIDNRVLENRSGIVLSRDARPVLRQNRLEKNQAMGLWVQDNALPDLGQSQDLGKNWFQDNQTWDLRNDTPQALASAGNQLNPNRVSGLITYLPSQIPDPIAVPPMQLNQVTPVPLPTPPAPEPPVNQPVLDSRFTDLVGHWSVPFVEALAEQGLVQGFLDGSFRPDSTVTRAQFAALVMATFPSQAEDSRRFKPFVDVPQGFWAREAIYRSQAQGFLSGFPDGTFRPDAPMTRIQAIVALVNGLALGSGSSSQLGVYRDRAQIPTYAIASVAAATQQQIVVNYPDPAELRPMLPITRAETAALVYQALVNQGGLPRLLSPFIVQPREDSTRFSDLDNHWARSLIEPLAAQALMRGFPDGSFQPDTAMTRAQFAALVVSAFAPTARRSQTSFRDVPPHYWAADAIQSAYRAGFLSGFPDYTFAPDHAILKLQVLLALVSGLQLSDQTPLSVLTAYRDRAQIPAYAQAAIATATRLGLVLNYPDGQTLHPNRAATRAEVAAMVYQSLVILQRLPPVASPYQVQRAA